MLLASALVFEGICDDAQFFPLFLEVRRQSTCWISEVDKLCVFLSSGSQSEHDDHCCLSSVYYIIVASCQHKLNMFCLLFSVSNPTALRGGSVDVPQWRVDLMRACQQEVWQDNVYPDIAGV